jgi:DnaJ-class molecular chaperone
MRTDKIKICKCCRGCGKTSQRVTVYESEMLECPKCKGSGRMRIKISVTPFVQDEE